MTTNNALELHLEGVFKASRTFKCPSTGKDIWHDEFDEKIYNIVKAALLDAPETVEGLEVALMNAVEPSYDISIICPECQCETTTNNGEWLLWCGTKEHADAILKAARLYAQSRKSAGVPGSSIKNPSMSQNTADNTPPGEAPQPPASAVDVEAIKQEAFQFLRVVNGPISKDSLEKVIDYLHARGLLCLSKTAVNEKQNDLSITDGKQSGLIGQPVGGEAREEIEKKTISDLDMFDRVMTLGSKAANRDQDGTLFRFVSGEWFWLSDHDRDRLRSILKHHAGE